MPDNEASEESPELTSRDGERDRDQKVNWLEDATVAVGLVLIATVLSFLVAWSFDEAQAYDTIDSIFNADPLTRRYIFAESFRDRVFFKHPNLGHFFNPAIRVIAMVLGGNDPANRRWQVALLVVPIAAGLKTASIFLTLRLLRFTLVESVVVAILSAVTFSHLVFASMPESFGLSGACLALLLLTGAWTLRDREPSKRRDRISMGLFIVLGTIGAGITVTNVIPFVLVLGCVERLRQPSLFRVARRVVAVCAAAGFLNLLVLAIFVGPSFEMERQRGMKMGMGYFHERPFERTVRFPAVVSNEFAPPAPGFVAKPERNRTSPYYTFKETAPKSLHHHVIPWVVWFGLIAGAWGCLRGPPQLRALAIASLLYLGFNVAFHSLWGSEEIILYSQHWEAGVILVLAGTLLLSERLRRWILVALAAGAVFLLVHNIGVVRGMLHTWEVEGPVYRMIPARDLVEP